MSETAEQIQRRMEAVRSDLAQDFGDVARSARRMLNWREYVRRYPWACMGTAAAIGYLVVPNKMDLISPDTETLLQLAERNALVVKPHPQPHERGGVLGMLFTLVAKTAVRGALSYLGQRGGEKAAEHAADYADH